VDGIADLLAKVERKSTGKVPDERSIELQGEQKGGAVRVKHHYEIIKTNLVCLSGKQRK